MKERRLKTKVVENKPIWESEQKAKLGARDAESVRFYVRAVQQGQKVASETIKTLATFLCFVHFHS